MPPVAWETRQINTAPRVTAPDGSDVRILCGVPAGSAALFSLAPGGVARAVVHRTVDEIWFVVAGRGGCGGAAGRMRKSSSWGRECR